MPLLCRDSLGKRAVTLDFMLVSTDITIGKPVFRPTVTMEDALKPSVLYTQTHQKLFDRTDGDEALFREVLKKIGAKPNHLLNLQAIAEAAGEILLFPPQNKKSANNANAPLPNTFEWEGGRTGTDSFASFVEDVIPFPKTRDWLFHQLEAVIAGEGEQFIACATITHRSVYSFH